MNRRIRSYATKMMVCSFLILSIVSIAPAQDEGEKIFKAKCAACHGVDGSAQTKAGQSLHAPDFHSPALDQASDNSLANVIANGKNKMPKFAERLTDKEIHSVVAYVRTLAKSHQ